LLSTTLMMGATFGSADLSEEGDAAAAATAQKQTSAQLLTESAEKLDKSNKNLRTVMDATKATVQESSKLLGISLDGVSASLTKSILPAFLEAVRGVSLSIGETAERLQGLAAQVEQLTQEKDAATAAAQQAAAENVDSQAEIVRLRAELAQELDEDEKLLIEKSNEMAVAAGQAGQPGLLAGLFANAQLGAPKVDAPVEPAGAANAGGDAAAAAQEEADRVAQEEAAKKAEEEAAAAKQAEEEAAAARKEAAEEAARKEAAAAAKQAKIEGLQAELAAAQVKTRATPFTGSGSKKKNDAAQATARAEVDRLTAELSAAQ
jgi:hypothetical protein